MRENCFVFDHIPFRPDIAVLKKSTFFTGDLDDEKLVRTWEETSVIARPKAIVQCVEVAHDAEGKVLSVGGQEMSSIVLDNNLSSLHRAFAFVATCGTEIAAVDGGDDYDLKSMLFTLRIAALHTAIDYASAAIRSEFGIEKVALMNPGSLPEWPLTEQPKLFAMLGDVKSAVGVTLGEHMFMAPMESSSGLMFETEHDYKNCMVCTRLDCIGRQAPYDAEMAKKYR